MTPPARLRLMNTSEHLDKTGQYDYWQRTAFIEPINDDVSLKDIQCVE